MTAFLAGRPAARRTVAAVAAYLLLLQALVGAVPTPTGHDLGGLVGIICAPSGDPAGLLAGVPDQPSPHRDHRDICCVLCGPAGHVGFAILAAVPVTAERAAVALRLMPAFDGASPRSGDPTALKARSPPYTA